MLDSRLLRTETERCRKLLARRGHRLDTARMQQLTELLDRLRAEDQSLRQDRNELSAEIGRKGADAPEELRRRAGEISSRLRQLSSELAEAEKDWRSFCLELPNLPDEEVPQGDSEADNQVLKVFDADGNIQSNDWLPPEHPDPKTHDEIGSVLGMYEPERAAAMSGTRFAILTDGLAQLHRALGQFFLDLQRDRGYLECWVPWLLQPKALEGSGQLPKFGDDLFTAGDTHYLLPTAEVPLVNFYANSILEDADLPIRLTALTPCFRSEAGSYGRDTRGLIRQHQFEKVELVCLTDAEQSENMLQKMLEDARSALLALSLPHRVVALCTGDLSSTSARTLDIEVWMPGQGQWREVSSCSNCRDFQTRRLGIRRRMQKSGKKTQLLHSLNGSALAVGRSLAALVENCWDGKSVRIPKPLQRYMNGATRLPRN